MEKKIIDQQELKQQCDKIVEQTKQCLQQDKQEVKRIFGVIKDKIEQLDQKLQQKSDCDEDL